MMLNRETAEGDLELVGAGRSDHPQDFVVIARAGIRTFISKRAFLGLLLVSWFPFFVRAVQFYAAANLTNIPQASMLARRSRKSATWPPWPWSSESQW